MDAPCRCLPSIFGKTLLGNEVLERDRGSPFSRSRRSATNAAKNSFPRSMYRSYSFLVRAVLENSAFPAAFTCCKVSRSRATVFDLLLLAAFVFFPVVSLGGVFVPIDNSGR